MHLKHLQSILLKFDIAAALTELTIVRYFEENLKPSIKAKVDQDADHLDSFKDLVTKAVITKPMAGLHPGLYVRKTDFIALRKSPRPYYHPQGTNARLFYKGIPSRKMKEKTSDSRFKQLETSKKSWEKKKKKI